MERHWDIFCAVIDNYGDAGVCWRLARQLVMEHGQQVRLWIDDMAALARLVPEVRPGAGAQDWDGVRVQPWGADFAASWDQRVAQVVVEGFACELPEAYLFGMAQMALADVAPLWLNLEYLSAEDWVEDCHWGQSPHPRLPLTRHFYFPGFTPQTGGLLREQAYARTRKSFNPSVFCEQIGIKPPCPEQLVVSLFAYENRGVAELLSGWAQGPIPVRCLVPDGRVLPAVRAWLGSDLPRAERGNLQLEIIPFLPQREYDKLLWLADLNFVRGEDSFVRAQWAGKPFVWQIYPQAERHHLVKMNAFLNRYLDGLADPARRALVDFWHAWESGAGLADAWLSLLEVWPILQAHALTWSDNLACQPDLCTRMMAFRG